MPREDECGDLQQRPGGGAGARRRAASAASRRRSGTRADEDDAEASGAGRADGRRRVPQRQPRRCGAPSRRAGSAGARMHAEAMAAVRARLVAELAPRPADTVLELSAGLGEAGLRRRCAARRPGRLITSDLSPGDARPGPPARCGARPAQRRVPRDRRGAHPARRRRGRPACLCQNGFMLMADPVAALRRDAARAAPRRAAGVRGLVDARAQPLGHAGPLGAGRRGHLPPPEPGAPGAFSIADQARMRARLAAAGFASARVSTVEVRFRSTTSTPGTAGPRRRRGSARRWPGCRPPSGRPSAQPSGWPTRPTPTPAAGSSCPACRTSGPRRSDRTSRLPAARPLDRALPRRPALPRGGRPTRPARTSVSAAPAPRSVGRLAPHAGAQARRERGAERRRLAHPGPHHRPPQDVGLQLHEHVVRRHRRRRRAARPGRTPASASSAPTTARVR